MKVIHPEDDQDLVKESSRALKKEKCFITTEDLVYDLGKSNCLASPRRLANYEKAMQRTIRYRTLLIDIQRKAYASGLRTPPAGETVKMGKGNAAKALDGGVGDAMKKKKGLKPMSAAMRERESDERKVLMRNRIELKRLQSVADRLRLDLQGFGEDSKKKERQIDPQYRLKGAARAALAHYLPPEPEFVPPPNLLDEKKGKIWYILPKGREFLQALYDLAYFLHHTFKKSKDAIECFKEILEHDDEDHFGVRTRIFQCYLDKGDTKSAQEFLQQSSTAVTTNPDAVATNGYQQALVLIKQTQRQKQRDGDAEDDEAIDSYLTTETLAALDGAVNHNAATLWVLAYVKAFAPLLEGVTDEEATRLSQETISGPHGDALRFVQLLMQARQYYKACGYLWQGSMVTAEVAPLSKVEKVANRQRGISSQPTTTYELSIFEEVLQEYIVERVLSPPTAPTAPTVAASKSKKNKPDTTATTNTTVAPLDELPQRVLQLYQQSVQSVQVAMLE